MDHPKTPTPNLIRHQDLNHNLSRPHIPVPHLQAHLVGRRNIHRAVGGGQRPRVYLSVQPPFVLLRQVGRTEGRVLHPRSHPQDGRAARHPLLGGGRHHLCHAHPAFAQAYHPEENNDWVDWGF